MDTLLDALAWVIPVVLAITLHEAAHGWVALKFGDDTAKQLGRVTFNPFKHVDRFGTILLPGLLVLIRSPVVFGYAKPVPVDFSRLSPPRTGMFAVAIAGVTVNFLLALVAGMMLHLESWITPEEAPWLYLNIYRMLLINCVLIAFNMLPILPLDGGRVVDAFLRGPLRQAYRKLERYGMPIVFLALFVPPILGFSVMEYVVGGPAFWLLDQVLWLTGNGSI